MVDVEDETIEAGEDDPDIGMGGPAVIGSTLGRKVELISPIPTKKSSEMQCVDQNQD